MTVCHARIQQRWARVDFLMCMWVLGCFIWLEVADIILLKLEAFLQFIPQIKVSLPQRDELWKYFQESQIFFFLSERSLIYSNSWMKSSIQSPKFYIKKHGREDGDLEHFQLFSNRSVTVVCWSGLYQLVRAHCQFLRNLVSWLLNYW